MSYVEELKRKDAEIGLVRRHVWWGSEGAKADAEEKARVLLDVQWQLERGHSARVQNLDRWTPGDQWRRFKAGFNRARDRVLFIKNPYRKEKRKL